VAASSVGRHFADRRNDKTLRDDKNPQFDIRLAAVGVKPAANSGRPMRVSLQPISCVYFDRSYHFHCMLFFCFRQARLAGEDNIMFFGRVSPIEI